MPDIPRPTVKSRIPLPKIRRPKNLEPALLFHSIPPMLSLSPALTILARLFLTGLICPALVPAAPAQKPFQVDSLRITLLSTNLAGNPGEGGIGEWGFSALVEADGHKILFDTGHRADTVLNNARELKIDLSAVTDVVLSHHHEDHTGGLMTLRRAWSEKSPAALSRAHVGPGAFWSRGPGDFAGEGNLLISIRPEFEATGGKFIEHHKPAEIAPGVWLTGPINRVFEEQRPMRNHVFAPDAAPTPDILPEDIALVIDTVKGLVVITGCGHAGLVNTLLQAQQAAGPDTPIYAAIGGFHLAGTADDRINWTAEKLSELGLQHLHGAHCTGIAPVYQIREKMGLARDEAHVGAVGATFDLKQGISPLWIAR